mmetsp:Transcript_99019/g.317592  ORF Transcript_99019/g.317592 Transcript_99019/m.317592 type:complete len:110 (-) Transcript_99019:111-440(-)
MSGHVGLPSGELRMPSAPCGRALPREQEDARATHDPPSRGAPTGAARHPGVAMSRRCVGAPPPEPPCTAALACTSSETDVERGGGFNVQCSCISKFALAQQSFRRPRAS